MPRSITLSSANDLLKGEIIPMRRIAVIMITLILILSFTSAYAAGENENEITRISVSYCAVECDSRPITAEYADAWLLGPPNEYNHKLMQVSFAMAASAFRDNLHDLDHKDYNILDFFSRAGFTDPQTDDYNKITSIDTIATAIAHKTVGDTTLIAVAACGNNYQNEWLSNFTVSDQERAKGFNDAAQKLEERIYNYISAHELSGKMRIWISGYSRAAAVANIAAADATESGLFDAVYGYTIGTPRTTKDTDAGRFDNIFNVINPFDPIPLMPFPEWGYKRYGIDLYLPAMETDSAYFRKKVLADDVSEKVMGTTLAYNPQVNAQLHTIMDYLLFFVRSSNSYMETFQSGILDLWSTREYKPLIKNIAEQIDTIDEITMYQAKEFYYFLDFLCQVVYSSFRGQKFHPVDLYWNPKISIQENLMHEHYDSPYLSWLFSTDDPDELFMKEPKYIHYTIVGDVDVEVFDSNGNFVERIDSSGHVTNDPAGVQTPGFRGKVSDTLLFAERNGKQTFIVLPMDQTFSAVIHSDKDQEVRYSFVEYSAGAIQGNVRYIYYDDLSKNGFYEGMIDLFVVDTLTEKDLAEKGFLVVEPWTMEAVYSPTAVMRLENTDIFHPSPLFFVTFSGMTLLFVLYLLTISGAGARIAVKTGIKKVRDRRSGMESKSAEAVHDKMDEGPLPEQRSAKDDKHENQ